MEVGFDVVSGAVKFHVLDTVVIDVGLHKLVNEFGVSGQGGHDGHVTGLGTFDVQLSIFYEAGLACTFDFNSYFGNTDNLAFNAPVPKTDTKSECKAK